MSSLSEEGCPDRPPRYAACVTPANCQMIIAAGQGATAAQAIDRDLFDESLDRHTLPRSGATEAGRPERRSEMDAQW